MSGGEAVFEGEARNREWKKARAAETQRGPEVTALRHRQGAVGSVVAFVAFGDGVGRVCFSEEVVLSRVPLEHSPEGKGEAVGASRRQTGDVQGQGIGEGGIVERI